MTPEQILGFMRVHRYAVQASATPSGTPQAAVVGVAITDQFEIIFDTLGTTRKAQNLRQDPHVAFVIGGTVDGEERTVQYEGIADEPEGDERTRIQQTYFARFPDGPGRLSWPGITYFRVRPTWMRYSDFSGEPPVILEFNPEQLKHANW